MQPRNIYDHHIANELPVCEDNKSPKAVLRLVGDVRVEKAQNAVDDKVPYISQDDSADEIGHKKYGPECICAPKPPCEGESEEKGEYIHRYQRYNGKFYRKPQGICEIAVGEDTPVIFKPRPPCIGDRGEFAEREVYSHSEGHKKGYDKRRKGGQDEKWKISVEISFHQSIELSVSQELLTLSETYSQSRLP